MKCEACDSDEGEETICPYNHDMYGEEIEVTLCTACYDTRVDDI